MTTISLCAIVKNEEEIIHKCLESVQGFVDEIVIIDTGSTDRTVEIAKSLGARVEHFEWINDFAAARNFALSHIKTDYALVLDADEVLYTGNLQGKESLIDTITRLDGHLGLLSLHQALSIQSEYKDIVEGNSRTGTPVLLPRIVPITDDVQYQGIVHEAPISLTREHLMLVTEIQVIHLGADPNWRKSRKKNERNLELLFEAMQESDDITQYYSYLASELSSAGKREEAYKMIEEGWKKYRDTPVEDRQIGNSLVLTVYPALLFHQNKQKEGFDALKFIFSQDTSDSPFSADPNVLYMTSRLLVDVQVSDDFKMELLETLEEMASLLIDSRDIPFLTEQMAGIMDYRSKELLAFIRIKMGKLDEAMQVIDELIAEFPDDNSYMLLKVECLISGGSIENVSTALNLLSPLLDDKQSMNDGFALATAASVILHESLGDEVFWNSAIDFWTHAAANSFKGFSAIHRLRFLEGFAVMKSMMDGQPTSGPGAYGVLGSLMTRQPNRSYTTVPKFVIRKSVYRMLELNHIHFIEPLLDPKAEETLLGINTYVREILEEIGIEIYDDEQPTPIFVGGKGSDFMKDIFEEFEILHVEQAFGYHQHIVKSTLEYHEAKQLEKDPFEDAFGWLNDDNTIEDDDIYEILQGTLLQFFTKISLSDDDTAKRFTDISENNIDVYQHLVQIFPKGRIIHFIEDPREFVLEQIENYQGEVTEELIKDFCLQWEMRISNARSFFQHHQEVYLETTLQLWLHNPQQQFNRIVCFLDLINADEVDLPEIENTQRWQDYLDPEHIRIVEEQLTAQITFLGFPITMDSEKEIPNTEEA